MPDLSSLPHQLDAENYQCHMVVETPRGSRIKFKFEPASQMFEISKFLPKGMIFPFEFGFVPNTVAEDGDPLDVIALMDEPAHVGVLLTVRLIGVLELVQTEDGKQTPDPRLVGIPLQSTDYESVTHIENLHERLTQQIVAFLETYNLNSGKEDRVVKIAGPERAIELVQTFTRKS